jgi:dienelactone hydrolase
MDSDMRIFAVLPLMTFFLANSLSSAAPAAPTSRPVEGEGFVADFWSTPDSAKKIGVLVLGGSEGGTPDRLAKSIARQGYPVLSLAYFKTAGTPDYLDMIPLEYFDKPIEWLRRQAGAHDGIVVIGGSKGAELALLLASMHPQITGVIAISPSSVVWQGLPKEFWPPRSSWSLDAKPVPFVPYDVSKGFNPNNLLALYEHSLEQTETVKSATIPVEQIHGAVLLFSGADDKLWPSARMADDICQRLKSHAFKYRYEHVDYPDAGHTLSEYSMIGGTADGNRKARLDSARRIQEFLGAADAGNSGGAATQP